jgi:hypothetical protein
LKRILFGLSQLPRGVSLDDPRLPGVFLEDKPLRLNAEPHRGEIAAPDHATRVAVLRAALCAACGDYAREKYRFVHRYFAFIAGEIDASRAPLEEGLQPYARLYTADDWTWSALRPLPRAWIRVGENLLPAGFAFWDGAAVIAVEGEATRVIALREAGITTLSLDGEEFPDSFRAFWAGELLPRSPFRLPWPGLGRRDGG